MSIKDVLMSRLVPKATAYLKSDYFKAQLLAFTRHVVTAAGSGLVVHGYATDGMVQLSVGLAVATVSFFWSQLDVKWVDGKIQIALQTPETPK